MSAGRWLSAFGRFWWEFIVGDTPELAVGVALVVVAAWGLAAARVPIGAALADRRPEAGVSAAAARDRHRHPQADQRRSRSRAHGGQPAR